MKRQDLKDVAEAIGFAAIIASLVFVGIESRNSTKQSMLNTQALAPVPIQTQVGRDFWDQRKSSFTENYRNHIDQMIANSAASADQGGE